MTSRRDRMVEVGKEIWASRPDLRSAFPDPDVWDFWYWCMWHGVVDHAELSALTYPLPDDFLIHRVVGQESDDEAYVHGGLVDWRRMYLCLCEGGHRFDRPGRVLDFGCGSGRILRYFARYADANEFIGADVDQDAVAWGREHLEFARFVPLPFEPKIPLGDAELAAAYAFSVFSHLPEKLHRGWLEELHRVLQPGGVLVVTVQGERVMEKIIAGGRSESIPSAAQVERDRPRIRESGFHFYPYGKLELGATRNQEFFDEWDLDAYGSTFILDHYATAHWGDLFHLVSWHAAPDDWQDYYVLRRKA